MHGLTRVRGMTQDDSHSYVTPEQAPAEIKHLLDFVPQPAPGLRARRLLPRALHPRRRQDGQVRRRPTRTGRWRPRCSRTSRPSPASSWCPDPGGAAFYGPKISVQCRDAIGRTWQMSTIQYDFNQPKGFELEFQAADGTRQQPVMIHSAKFGSHRAVLRRPRRALRRRLPAVAGAGPGAGHPDRGAAQRLPVRRREADAGARACGSRSTTPTTGCRRRSATPSCRRCRSW